MTMTTSNTPMIKKYPAKEFFGGANNAIDQGFLRHARRATFNASGIEISAFENASGSGYHNSTITPITPELGQPIERGLNQSTVIVKPQKYKTKAVVSEHFNIEQKEEVIKLFQEQVMNLALKSIYVDITTNGYLDTPVEGKQKIIFAGANSTSKLVYRSDKPFSHEEMLKGFKYLNSKGLINGAYVVVDIYPDLSIRNKYDEEMLKTDNILPGSVGTWMGLPVYQQSVKTSDTEFAAWSIAAPQYYTYMLSDEVTVYETQPTAEEALKGIRTVMFEVSFGGALTDKYARQTYKLLPYGTVAGIDLEQVENPTAQSMSVTSVEKPKAKKSGGKN